MNRSQSGGSLRSPHTIRRSSSPRGRVAVLRGGAHRSSPGLVNDDESKFTVLRPCPAGQLAGLLHPTGESSFVELVAFPHVEGALGFGRKGARGNGRQGGAVEEDQLEVGPEGGDRPEPALAGCG